MQKELKPIIALFKQLVDVSPFLNIPIGHFRNGTFSGSTIETYRTEDNVFAVTFGNSETGRIELMCYDTTQFDTRTFVKSVYIHTSAGDLRRIERAVKDELMTFLSACAKRGEE